MPDFEPIVGRYTSIDISSETHRIFVEEAGKGIPLLCLHTAGNDSRQGNPVTPVLLVTAVPDPSTGGTGSPGQAGR
jgi:hypothetical protein